jgi:hypothetical protein
MGTPVKIPVNREREWQAGGWESPPTPLDKGGEESPPAPLDKRGEGPPALLDKGEKKTVALDKGEESPPAPLDKGGAEAPPALLDKGEKRPAARNPPAPAGLERPAGFIF